MSSALTTTVTELPESRVRVQVQVPPSELSEHVERKARQLGRDLRLPGFRRGKVPAQLVLQRVGRETVLEEAVRDSLTAWYVDALAESGIAPVGDPNLDLGDLPDAGQALQFSFEVGVLPKATLGEYKGLEVGRREPTVSEELIDRELDKLRDRLARLESADRPAAQGDFVVIDYVGEPDEGAPFPGDHGRDQLVELGRGDLIPGFEQGLLGARAGEQRSVSVSFPDPYPANPELAGRAAVFAVTVKDVKQKLLPEIDEDFASDAGFDSLEELRADLRARLQEVEEGRIESEFRYGALDAAVAQAAIDVPQKLVQDRAREMWERTLHELAHQGISREAYLRISGHDTDEQIIATLASDAERGLRREAVVAAVIAAEQIEPDDQDLAGALAPLAEREGLEPEELMRRLGESGRLQDLREEVAARAAIDLIAEQSKPIALEQAQAREALWTPGRDSDEQRPSGVWTPERPTDGGPRDPGPARLWTPTDQGSTS